MQVQNNSSTSQTRNSGKVAAPAAVNSSATSKITPPSVLSGGGALPNSNAAPSPSSVSPEEIAQKFDLVPSKKVKSRAAKKQIPTAIGLLILFVALISGVLLFGQGTGVFAPRATPETTPKNIQISNVTDKTFTVSFYTDESTVGFVKYGLEANSLKQQASDDRDQLSGIVKDYRLHHVTVRGLEPGVTYYYVLGTGSNTFDNQGQPYSVTTAIKPSQSPTSNQTVYGNIYGPDGGPAEGAIVYVNNESIGELSSIVKASGSFGISLGNAFSLDKTTYANLSDDATLEIKVQGIEPNLVSSLQTTVALSQPVQDLVLGKGGVANVASTDQVIENREELLANLDELTSDQEMAASDEAQVEMAEINQEAVSSAAGALENMLGEVDSTPTKVEVLDLDELSESQDASIAVVNTTTPQIKATLPANTIVRVTVHSETKIDQTIQTDADGNLILDLASLGESLEPGEHTATYSYIDPITGQEVTKTYNFTVAPEVTRQLAQASTPSPTPTTVIPSIPYGSGNPYVPGENDSEIEPTTSPTAVTSPTVTSSAGATVATDSGQYNSGSLGTTLTLLLAGLFFVSMGVWSYALSNSFEAKNKN